MKTALLSKMAVMRWRLIVALVIMVTIAAGTMVATPAMPVEGASVSPTVLPGA
jgi:hypothetical protein